MKYLTSIGLEIHIQLKTQSKMFCGCSTDFDTAANTNVCPVCLGYPGAMPVMNETAIKYTVIAGLMIGCRISEDSRFDRKSYFYPDMPKNYQISQFDRPLCIGGSVDFEVDGKPESLNITRIHLEEDVGKSIHSANYSGVNFNRAGIPLMEIVTEPEITSPSEAFEFLLALRQIMVYSGISDCNLEKGNLRCDVNCSLRPEGQEELGVKAEIKNMNTFRGVHDALEYEIMRQRDALESGEKIIQETRRWDPDVGVTASMRTKEDSHDYRYFPEPDLMPVILDRGLVAEWEGTLPELPHQRRDRFIEQYGLPEYDAGVLTSEKKVADYFEEAANLLESYKAISNWIMTEIMRHLSEKDCEIDSIQVKPADLCELIGLVEDKTINSSSAKEVLGQMLEKGGRAKAIVEQKGLIQVSDSGELSKFVEQAISENPQSVEDFKNGKKAALQFLMGQVMRLSRGKAAPQVVMGLLKEQLS